MRYAVFFAAQCKQIATDSGMYEPLIDSQKEHMV